MTSHLSYKNHLSGPSDLVTTHEEIRSGFLALAFEKNLRMTPIVAEANALKQAAKIAKQPKDLLEIQSIQYALLKAAGISDKAETYLTDRDKREAKLNLITKFLEPAVPGFVDELIYRFLITQGDALGGIMRNVGGKWGKIKFIDMMRACLRNSGYDYEILLRDNKSWYRNSRRTISSEDIKALRWSLRSRDFEDNFRTLIVDFTVKFFGKNVDACLFKGTKDKLTDAYYQNPVNYVSLGELKGGIDPAGADEHWKTGNTALQRIRNAFFKLNLEPMTFFVGAAIENAMATEIWEQLENGTLSPTLLTLQRLPIWKQYACGYLVYKYKNNNFTE